MKYDSIKEFFIGYLGVSSALVGEDYRLRHKELMFLVECCMYHHEGGDLNNIDDLSQHMLDIKFFNRKTDTSLYKYKLSVKKWISAGRNKFILPGLLGERDTSKLNYTLNLRFEQESISD